MTQPIPIKDSFRIHAYLAKCGVASRRKSEEFVEEGRVFVDGTEAVIGQSVTGKENVTLDGKSIQLERFEYYALNKPRGVLSTTVRERNTKCVLDFLPRNVRLFPVGRLDKDAEGLMILTNDGLWANILSHPRYEVEKEYRVIIERPLASIPDVVIVEGKKVKVKAQKISDTEWLITVHEGMKHIVKNIISVLGSHVRSLRRERIGTLVLGNLRQGLWRMHTNREIASFTIQKEQKRAQPRSQPLQKSN